MKNSKINSKNMNNKDYYINVAFFVFVFVFANSFLKDIIASHLNPFLIFSSIISFIVSVLFILIIRKSGFSIKIILLVVFTILLIIVRNYFMKEKLKISEMQGKWHSVYYDFDIKNNKLLLKEKKGKEKEYEIEIINDNSIKLYDDYEFEILNWEIQSIAKDKIILRDDKNQLVTFGRVSD